MRTDGIFTLKQFPIVFQNWDEPIYLICFGDIHRDSKLCHVDKWKEALAWAKNKRGAYFLGTGDYHDLGSTSERRLLNSPDLHESTIQTLDQLYEKNVRDFYEEIKFMKGRLIGLMGGNHFGMFKSGISTDRMLAHLMGVEYLGACSFIRLQFRSKTKHRTYCAVDIFAHHGTSGGKTIGASINAVQNLEKIASADIYLMGHDHKKGTFPEAKLELQSSGNHLRLRQKKILYARTGSFLRAYVDGEASYVVDQAGRPSDLGLVKIELTPRRSCKDGEDREWIDIHASV